MPRMRPPPAARSETNCRHTGMIRAGLRPTLAMSANSTTRARRRVRFNPVDPTSPRGTRAEPARTDTDAFCGGVFGWDATDVDLLGQRCHLPRPDDGQFILLAGGDKPMQSPGYDHLGLLC